MEQSAWNDIVEWDVVNWKRAIEFWDVTLGKMDLKHKKVLDLGARNGGLSLYFALRGADVVCSDVEENGLGNAKKLHKAYDVDSHIEYQIIDATNIPYSGEFDIICFKSVLGGVGHDDNFAAQRNMMESIRRALKDKGLLFFVENLKASAFHRALRKKFQPWGVRWRYIEMNEVMELLAQYSQVYYGTYGFLGCLGRRERTRRILGEIDIKIEHCVRDKNKYILSCIATK